MIPGLPKRTNATRLFPSLAFLLSLLTYWLTVEPGASLWDCPEYIDGALRLEIGHPPGNPIWLLTHRVISLFGVSPSGAVLAINMAAGFFTAWAAGLLCACSQRVLRLIFSLSASPFTIGICSLLGSLCFAWADSPWFSAVEAEVYAMSLWMTALCIWLMVRWLELRLGNQPNSGYQETVRNEEGDQNDASHQNNLVGVDNAVISVRSDRDTTGKRRQILVLISYILGLSIGVHQLTMLIIPGLAMMICYGEIGPGRRARGRQWLAAVIGAVTVGGILLCLMKGVPRLLAQADLIAVNDFGWNYNMGALAMWSVILALLTTAAYLLTRYHRFVAGEIAWCLLFVCIGFSGYALIIVRAAANPPMNQGAPSDIFSFISYIDRDQYGGAPLLYGSTPNSRPLKREHITVSDSGDTVRKYYDRVRTPERAIYSPNLPGGQIPNSLKLISTEEMERNATLSASEQRAYLLTGYKYKTAMVPELEMWFPRLHSSAPNDVAAYEDWTGMNTRTMEEVAITEAADSLGNPIPMRDADGKPIRNTALRPTAMQNLTMLFGYQSGYMYFRYLLWNFAGRQNDIHSTGEVEHGNFITGFTPLDNMMLGAEDMLPDSAGQDNPGRNRYFMIPLILGLLGLVWLCFTGKRGRRVAGVSAVLFLMTGLAIVLYLNQTPGEPRERDYSFLGSFWVFAFWIATGMAVICSKLQKRLTRVICYCVLGCVPLWMLAENYDDHDRSGRYPADEYGAMVLGSLPNNAILFTTGDNHTFPLWYARNARGVRRDVTIVNTSYMQLPWQVLQLMYADENGQRVEMTMRPEDIVYGGVAAVRLGRDTTVMDAVEALGRLYADTAAVPVLPTSRLLIGGENPVVFDVTERYGIQPGGTLNLRQLAMLDIVATNAVSRHPRPIAWHRILVTRGMYGWEPYLSPTSFACIREPDSAGRYVAESRNRIQKTRLQGKPGKRYIDPVYGDLISYQRLCLMTEARRAIEAGDTAAGRGLLSFVVDRYPFSEWGAVVKAFCGEVIDEALLYADLADKVGLYPALADSLRTSSSESRNQWRRYHGSLPPRLRKAMTPADRHLAVPD